MRKLLSAFFLFLSLIAGFGQTTYIRHDTIKIQETKDICNFSRPTGTVTRFTDVCMESGTNASLSLNANTLCGSIKGLTEGVDTICMQICSSFGFCDTTIVYINVISAVAPPSITQQPINQKSCVRAALSLSIEVKGDGVMSYQWETSSDSVAFSAIPQATSAIFTPPTNVSGVSFYRCRIKNQGGMVISNPASVTILPQILLMLASTDASICANSGKASFSILTVGGEGLKYQWQMSENGTAYSDITNSSIYSGTATTILNVTNPNFTGLRFYRAFVSSSLAGCTSITSSTTQLEVNNSSNICKPESELKVDMPSQNVCTPLAGINISAKNQNNQAWVRFFRNDNIAIEMNAIGNNLGNVGVSYVRSDSTRIIGGQPYLNRNFGISVDTQPKTPVAVRVFFTAAEFDSLKQAYGSNLIASDLRISYIPNGSCQNAFMPTDRATLITPKEIVQYNGKDYYLEFETSTFSAFYINGPRGVLSKSQDLTDNTPLSIQAVYPNPTSDFVHLKVSANLDNPQMKLSLTDIFGRTILVKETALGLGENEITLDVKGLKEGIYFIKIENKNFKTIVKLFKQ